MIQFGMKVNLFLSHPKFGWSTKLPTLDDLQACTESSKIGLYKTSNFGWLRNTFTFTQNWIIQIIQSWMMHNHPKVDYTKLPPLDDLQTCSESSKSGLYRTSIFGWYTSMLRIIQKWISYTKHPILDDLETSSLSSQIGSYKSSKFGWFHPLLSSI